MFSISLVVLLPTAALVARAGSMEWAEFQRIVLSEQVMGAYRLTIGAAALAATLNLLLGTLLAWVLGRYEFPGKRAMDTLIDLPFALPTAVAGIALAFLCSDRGWIGQLLAASGFTYPWPTWTGFDGGGWWPIELRWYGRITSAPLGVVVALTFVGLPFVVRTLQPVVRELESATEEAALSLGAGRWTMFRRIILPQLMPAMIAGFTLAFARGLGEYGSVIFLAGNRPETEIAAHKIIELIEEDDTFAAPTAVAVVLLGLSFVLLLLINAMQRRLATKGTSLAL